MKTTTEMMLASAPAGFAPFGSVRMVYKSELSARNALPTLMMDKDFALVAIPAGRFEVAELPNGKWMMVERVG